MSGPQTSFTGDHQAEVDAVVDSSMRTNPRMPLIEELTDLLRAGYYG